LLFESRRALKICLEEAGLRVGYEGTGYLIDQMPLKAMEMQLSEMLLGPPEGIEGSLRIQIQPLETVSLDLRMQRHKLAHLRLDHGTLVILR
jgi:hypothetical protein